MTSAATIARRTVAATLLLWLPVLSACTLPGQDQETTGVETSAAPSSTARATQQPGSVTTAAASGTAYDLRFVTPTAAACSVVWKPGAVLPENYEWCADEDGDPVAGIRIGSCEVVTHRNEMYAVPGEPISPTLGAIGQDRQFVDLLTSCKRHPAARS